MIFECRDLDRALANPDLLAELQQHIRTCEACRNQYHVWTEISNAATHLHQEWESPALWPSILAGVQAHRPEPKRWYREGKLWTATAAAAAILACALIYWPHSPAARAGDQDFLTEQALKEVEKNEAAYRRSIDELSRLAQPKLESASSPLLLNYREKLLMLDSAILETRASIAQNEFNAHLQSDLADLYREKRQTLEEVLTHVQRN
jgi:hypothetical protein